MPILFPKRFKSASLYLRVLPGSFNCHAFLQAFARIGVVCVFPNTAANPCVSFWCYRCHLSLSKTNLTKELSGSFFSKSPRRNCKTFQIVPSWIRTSLHQPAEICVPRLHSNDLGYSNPIHCPTLNQLFQETQEAHLALEAWKALQQLAQA